MNRFLTTLTAGILVLAAACSDGPTRDAAPTDLDPGTVAGAPGGGGGNPGAIWTTEGDCGASSQDVNHFSVGQAVYINGNNFDDGTYDWQIVGNPGGSSNDPGITVAYGTLTLSGGVPTQVTHAGQEIVAAVSNGDQFCFFAYTVRPDDGGEYKYGVGNKNDNYRVDGLLNLAKTADADREKSVTWDVSKTAEPTELSLFAGDQADVQWTISVDKTVGSETFLVYGNVTVTNESEFAAPATVEDCIFETGDTGYASPLACVEVATSIASGENTFPYEFDFLAPEAGWTLPSEGGSYVNRVTVSIETADPFGDVILEATAGFTVPVTNVYDEVNVTDSNGMSFGPWGDDASASYTETFSCSVDPADYTDHAYSRTESNVAIITETGDSDDASVDIDCYELDVSKDALARFDRTWMWTIDKSINTALLSNYDEASRTAIISTMQTLPVEYNVVVDASYVDDDFSVDGTITVHNPNPDRAADLDDVTDDLEGVGSIGVLCSTYMVPAGASIQCIYGSSLPDDASRLNTATATLQNYVYDWQGNATAGGTTDFTGTADVIFGSTPDTETDECVDVSDLLEKDGELVEDADLGQVCAGTDPLPVTFTYVREFAYGGIAPVIAVECGDNGFDNTASFITNDSGTTGDDSDFINIFVACGEGCTLTQGYWKTHNYSFKMSDGPPGPPSDETWALLDWPPPGDGSFDKELEPFYWGENWFEVFWTPPKGGNAYYILAHQFQAAYLNVLSGADIPSEVLDAWNAGKALLEAYGPSYDFKADPDGVRSDFIDYAGTLADYNEGLVGPGHCTDDHHSDPGS